MITFSKQKLYTLRPQKSKAFSTFLTALFVAAAVFVPYIIADDGYFMFYGDFNVQQIPFYRHAHELIRSGNIGWDFGTDLGANFIGSYTFYLLGSPFFWLTVPFSNSFVPHLIGPLLILKFACCALTAYWYLDRFVRKKETARLGALLYAFSGFSVYNIFFNHFHEALIVFPLLLLSIELLITENRRGVFALAVCLCAVTNYFFFFGMVVFTVIYWLVRILSGAFKMTVSRFLSMLFEAVLGLLMSAFILLPAAMAIMGNSRLSEIMLGWGAWLYGKEQIYANVIQCFLFPPDLPARPVFFPGADVKWSSLGGWMPIFSLVGVLAWVKVKKGNWLKRIIIILSFMALVPILNSSFYMFNTAYYARWYYMLILMQSLATCMAIEDEEADWHGAFKWITGITLAFVITIGFMPQSIDEDGTVDWGLYVKDGDNVFRDRFFLSCFIALISLVILRVLLIHLKRNIRFFLRGATVCVCIMSVVYASLFVGLGKTHSYDVDKVMIPLIEGELSLEGDREDYRTDAYECVDNTGMYLGFSCINTFHSIVPSSVTEFYKFVGEERGVASRPTTASYAARSLLSVRYLLDLKDGNNFEEDGSTKMPGFSYYATQNGYDIYENDNYIPYGFTYDYYITTEECAHYGAENADDMMLKAITLSEEQINKYGTLLVPLSRDYSFDGSYDYDKKAIYFDYGTLASDCAARRATAAYDFSVNGSEFTAKIKLDRDNLVFFSIPYDDGWTAYVNGEKAEIEKVNIGFMAVRADEGDCEIRFVYETPGLRYGILISAICVAVLLIYLLFCKYFCGKRPDSCRYPEGDELIAKWRGDETREAVCELSTEPSEPADKPYTEDSFLPLLQFEGGFQINRDAFSQKTVDKDDKNG